MRKIALSLTLLSTGLACTAQQTSNLKPEDTEYYSPKIREVTIKANNFPSDAIVLFDGTNLDQWISSSNKDQAAQWDIADGIMTVKPKAGSIQTKEVFDDFQLHLEWKSPSTIKGQGQGRGNSGVFLQGKYEIQVLDNKDNPTYVNGQAGSLYKQKPPLVDVKATGSGWHTYDIIYSAPRFNKDGHLIKKGNVTVLHNGVVIQNHTQIEGTTEYIGLPKIEAHGKGPIILQDHGDLVSFRNIWIRKL